MTIQTIIILAIIGIFAGILSGFVGVGGGVIIVPSMPVVIFAVMNYWKSGNIEWKYGLVIAATFLIGAYVGSKLSLKLSPGMVKLIFGVFLAYVSFRLILSGYSSISSNES